MLYNDCFFHFSSETDLIKTHNTQEKNKDELSSVVSACSETVIISDILCGAT